MRDVLETILKENGAALVGVADLWRVPAEQREGFPFGVAVAVALDREIVAGITEGPNRLYWQEYKRANALLEMLGQRADAFLREAGYAVRLKAPTAEAFGSDLRTLLPHKTVATQAGLGWIGKNALLVTKGYGSAVRLSSLLTDAPLPCDAPVLASLCAEECRVCVTACPGGAPTGSPWRIDGEREQFFDAHACRRQAKTLSRAAGIAGTLCGICLSRCPWTQAYCREKTD